MARPAATRRSSTVGSALAVTLVAWLLVLQLLLVAPAPAAATRGISSSGVKKLLGLAKKASKLGRQSRIREARRRNSNTDMLGSAAADDAGFIVLYNVSVGATAQSKVVSGVVDVLNGFVWTTECPAAPVRVPCASQTCRSLVTNETTDACGANTGDRCEYVYMYGAEFNTTGYVANETLTVGVGGTSTMMASASLLGCSNTSTVPLDGAPGSFGFNRGPLSLVSQLGVNKFSYYLVPDEAGSSDSESIVLLGDAAVPQTRRGGRSTPLLRSTALPDYYYVKLTSIQVDGQALGGIPAGAFDLAADGSSGGVVMSTLSAVTYLQADAYNALKQVMMRKIKAQVVNGSALGDFDLCYNAQSVAALTFPKITLVLDGATLELTSVHYFYRDNVTGLQCLTMLPTPASVPFGSILGSMVQAGTNMIYDVGAGTLTLEEGAAAPVPSQVSLMAVASLLLAWLLLF
ncbi:aspartic proteinase nepenthesin-1-like [Hordeum vulgare subsp. vulgare]|uniref:Peptidase A1 domain-containing protein n=1 Tax=Hordeum vulgare subsp. vulgare TaxID=112509 RepID=A0A8I6Y9T5_HORVV|nr:aspartic proteinase nepenthesin-1-like [Hordeum vulgare subsp. vulgare]